MRKLFWMCALAAWTLSSPAQLFSPESLSGAFWGSLIGGTVGGDCHNGFSGEGAAIGAGVGLLAGAIAGESRRQYYNDAQQPYVYAPATSVSFGYGYGSPGSSAYVYYAPNSYCAPGYYYRPARPNYAVGGTLLGAASGALIGAGNKQAGEGAAIGAAAGLVLGSVAEHAARRQERRTAQTIQANSTPQPQMQETVPSPQPETSQRPESQITSTPAANSTYHWTARPQIADAPRVPDAPTF